MDSSLHGVALARWRTFVNSAPPTQLAVAPGRNIRQNEAPRVVSTTNVAEAEHDREAALPAKSVPRKGIPRTAAKSQGAVLATRSPDAVTEEVSMSDNPVDGTGVVPSAKVLARRVNVGDSIKPFAASKLLLADAQEATRSATSGAHHAQTKPTRSKQRVDFSGPRFGLRVVGIQRIVDVFARVQEETSSVQLRDSLAPIVRSIQEGIAMSQK